MKKYIVGVSDRYFLMGDGNESKDLCAFRVGDRVKIKALLKPQYIGKITYIKILEDRIWIRIEHARGADSIAVDTIEEMSVVHGN